MTIRLNANVRRALWGGAAVLAASTIGMLATPSLPHAQTVPAVSTPSTAPPESWVPAPSWTPEPSATPVPTPVPAVTSVPVPTPALERPPVRPLSSPTTDTSEDSGVDCIDPVADPVDCVAPGDVTDGSGDTGDDY